MFLWTFFPFALGSRNQKMKKKAVGGKSQGLGNQAFALISAFASTLRKIQAKEHFLFLFRGT